MGPDDQPLDGFRVRLRYDGEAEYEDISARCTADGFFELACRDAQPATLLATHDWNEDESVDDRCAVLHVAGGAAQDLRLPLRQGLAVTGRVVDDKGAPPARMHVRLRGRLVSEYRYREDGAFQFHGLPDDDFELDVQVRDGPRVTRRVGPGEVEVVLPAK